MFILVIFLKKIIDFIIRKSLNPKKKKKKTVLQVLIFLPSIIYFLSSKK